MVKYVICKSGNCSGIHSTVDTVVDGDVHVLCCFSWEDARMVLHTVRTYFCQVRLA